MIPPGEAVSISPEIKWLAFRTSTSWRRVECWPGPDTSKLSANFALPLLLVLQILPMARFRMVMACASFAGEPSHHQLEFENRDKRGKDATRKVCSRSRFSVWRR